ncbi:hypothetical protein PENSPDRAFT_650014 [Peniophora sp. CONT]|nr:hypothetical protein PENSPDRAFT_650014 [Peniophora sp. CONT]
MSSATLQVIYDQLVSGLNVANVSRYLTAAGLVILLHDHLLTLSEEVNLIWRAPRSFAKFAFLGNRYLVLAALIDINIGSSGLTSLAFTNQVCQGILFFSSFASVVSIGIANLLILVRVLLLWDKERHILITLAIAWFLSYCATIGLMTATVVILAPGIEYNAVARLCTVTTASPTLIAVWGCPMLFEITVCLATLYNGFARPRASDIPLAGVLHRDGALFFFCVTCLRVVNLAFAATLNPQLIALPVFLTWALITVCVNRLLLHIRNAEVRLAVEEKRALAAADVHEEEGGEEEATSPATPMTPASGVFVLNGRASPFNFALALNLHPNRHHDDEDGMREQAAVLPITLIDMQSFYR